MKDANERLHQDWLGMAQPDGLVVTTTALKAAEANITWPVIELQATLRDLAGETKVVLDLRKFLADILGWSDEFVVDREHLPEVLKVPLDGGEFLTPHFALRSADEDGKFIFVAGLPEKLGGDLDAATDDKRWTATPHQKFERLLRETGVHAGLLTNGRVFRLVYAPKGESAGWITFRVAEMLSVDGRPLLGAIHMLLNQRRLLSLEPEKRLLGLLKASREYQNTVSNALREQILAALRELLHGFEHADRVANGAILGEIRREHLQESYVGLVTVLMRMVFVLFAEERGLLPMENELYASSYSLTRLYAQLVEDRGRFGDGLDDRYGAWARIITLFRVLHDGVKAADGLALPARRGDFFDSNAFPFLEGRSRGSARQVGESLDIPRISDGVVFRVLDQLLVLGGERLQYRGLDVEQIGSVYEGLMGFEVEIAEGPSLCLTPDHVVVNLEQLLRQGGPERAKALKEKAGLELKDKAGAEVKASKTVEALQVALSRRISPRQPGLIGMGSLYLQPGEERRKSGSHYTPKSLTAPIVETTLRPVLERLRPDVAPEQILDLKVCDPAMGSGAFLVEACRQLADLLVAAWRRTNTMPDLPQDEDPVLHARRLIAQRCLYGVDKNPLAVDLARLSLWLVTFAKEHPFTFVDHALRCGDSLVGLSKEQIANLALDVKSDWKQLDTVRAVVLPAVQRAEDLRRQIHSIGDPPDTERLVELWRDANEALHTVRMLGDLVVAAFFSADSDKARKKSFDDLSAKVATWLATGQHEAELKGMVADLREREKPITPFHWEIEFPEVFVRATSGFDCFVGNPPFLGGSRVSGRFGRPYLDFQLGRFPGAHGNGDLVAYFFRRSYELLRRAGTLGLIATNSIAQGDTRTSGLRWICTQGGQIFCARRRVPWPGEAAVVVSIVHIAKDHTIEPVFLDGKPASQVTAFLFQTGGHENPRILRVNHGLASKGVDLGGLGFLFADGNAETTSLSEMKRLLKNDPRNRERVFPYIGGEDLNERPHGGSDRYVVDFTGCDEEEVRRWPDLARLLEAKVGGPRSTGRLHDVPWWLFERPRAAFFLVANKLERILAIARVSDTFAFTVIPRGVVVNEKIVAFRLGTLRDFSLLQSRLHEAWARAFSSTMKDDLQYTPSECFETFPFSTDSEHDSALETLGKLYFEFRGALMARNNQGLTKTYNRFHGPDECSPDICELRDLHAQVDRAVLDAYGWTDIKPVYDFREQLDESIRLTWADETRDEVLARLLELNRVIAQKEADEAPKAEVKVPRNGRERASGAGQTSLNLPLWHDPED